MANITKTRSFVLAAVLLLAGPALGAIYNDATGEGSILNTWPHLDISSVEVKNTATNISFQINLVGNPIATSWGEYQIGINSISGGATNGIVPNGRPITMSVGGMDYWIRSWNTGAETYHWNAAGSSWVQDNATWAPPSAIQSPVKTTNSVTLTMTLASLGMSVGDSFFFDVSSSGSTATDSAVDALANPNPTSASGDWASPYDSGTNVYKYTVTTDAPPPLPPSGVGATLPYREYEAENAVTTGTIIGPSRTYLNQATEASGRKAVSLNSTGQYVEFTLEQAANSIVVRYCIPDSANGAGDAKTLSLYTNGVHCQDLTLTSTYSWVYGTFPFSNTPGDGSAHHFFDEVSALIGELPAGTKVRLQKDSTDTASYYLIDLADFEEAPPAQSMPAGYLSITSYGATPNDGTDDTVAFRNAVAAAQTQTKGLWIPPGRFNITGRVTLTIITVRGAGPWYSTLQGLDCNLYGNGGKINLSDFKLDGQTTTRTDGISGSGSTGIEGMYGSGSVISNIWVEHTNPGMWITGPTSGLLVTGCRVRDTFADGINLAAGVANTRVENCNFRNNGDDSMAMWSDSQNGISPDQNNIFQNNTIQLPILANGIGIYGGNNNSVVNNWIKDIVWNGAGIQIANRFIVFPLGGTTLIQGNQLDRTGSRSTDFGINVGALWLFAYDSDITGLINVTNNIFNDSTYQGILLSGSSTSRSITGTTFDTLNVNGAGSYGIQVNTKGAGYFRSMTFSNTPSGLLLLNNANYQIRHGLSAAPAPPNAYAIGNVATFNWPPVIDLDGGTLGYHVCVGTTPGASNVLNTIVTSTNVTVTNVIGNTLYAFVSVINNGNLEGPPSTTSTGVLLLDASADQDGDGMSNQAEDVAATNPLDPNSVLRIISLANGNLLTWSSVSNKTYQVMAATNLVTGFNHVGGVITAVAPTTFYLDVPPADQIKFYRVKVVP